MHLQTVKTEAARAYILAHQDYLEGRIGEFELRVIRDTYRNVAHAFRMINHQYDDTPAGNVRVMRRVRKDPERAHRF